MVFHWSLSDSKSPQVSNTFISILGVLKNAVVLMVSVRLPIYNSSSPLTKPFGFVLCVPITVSTTINLIFHSFFLVSVKF